MLDIILKRWKGEKMIDITWLVKRAIMVDRFHSKNRHRSNLIDKEDQENYCWVKCDTTNPKVGDKDGNL